MVHLADQTVNDPYEKLERRIRKLESQLREERAARRLESASIGKGGITVKDGGSIRVYDADGNIIGLIGGVPGNRGVWLQRAGGHPAFAVHGSGGDDPGFVGLYDLAGNYIFTDDVASGRGLGRPYLHLTVGEISAPAATTSSSTFGDLAVGMAALHHPVLYAYLLVRASDATTAGEVRIALNGAGIGPVAPIAAGSYALASVGPFKVPDPGPYRVLHTLSVQARRTAGAGTVGVRVMSMVGLESAYAP